MSTHDHRIIDYKILMHNSSDSLRGLVRAAIAEGWQPLGGVAVMYSPAVISWWQAVAKYAPAFRDRDPEKRAYQQMDTEGKMPPPPKSGDRWIDQTSGIGYIWHDGRWVEASIGTIKLLKWLDEHHDRDLSAQRDANGNIAFTGSYERAIRDVIDHIIHEATKP